MIAVICDRCKAIGATGTITEHDDSSDVIHDMYGVALDEAFWDRRISTGEDLCPACQPKTPEWRRPLEKWEQSGAIGASGSTLAAVLWLLHHMAILTSTPVPDDESEELIEDLARIVVVCEQEVGDGWQADPDSVKCVNQAVCDVDCLLECLDQQRIEGEYRWRSLGQRAASWLRYLTGKTYINITIQGGQK